VLLSRTIIVFRPGYCRSYKALDLYWLGTPLSVFDGVLTIMNISWFAPVSWRSCHMEFEVGDNHFFRILTYSPSHSMICIVYPVKTVTSFSWIFIILEPKLRTLNMKFRDDNDVGMFEVIFFFVWGFEVSVWNLVSDIKGET
jgi:hypothetical protein